MKKEERLHRLFGEIDDDLVAGAAAKPIPIKVWLPRITAAVAAVALTVGGAVLHLLLPAEDWCSAETYAKFFHRQKARQDNWKQS